MRDAKVLDKNNVEDILALTQIQEGILFQNISNPDSDIYFEQIIFLVSGNINIDLFKKSWNIIGKTNEMLRTIFRWEKLKKPVQVILKNYDLPIRIFDFSSTKEPSKEKLLNKIKILDKNEKVDISIEPFRITLCKLEEEKYYMILSFNHIILDGWSTSIILKEFLETYNQLQDNISLRKCSKNSFKKYINILKDGDKKSEENFWSKYMNGINEQTFLQGDLVESEKTIPSIDKYTYRIPREIKLKIENFIKENEVTMATFIYFAWGILLQKYNNSNDVIFGTTVSGRNLSINGIEDIVGLFINTIPLKVTMNTELNIALAMKMLHDDIRSRQSYETTSINDIKKYSGLSNFECIFNTIVVVDNYPIDKVLFNHKGNINIELSSVFEMTEYDLTLQVMNFEDIDICFSYNKNFFTLAYIERLMSNFTKLILNIVNSPSMTMANLGIISYEEKRQILGEFNNTFENYSSDKTLHELFQDKVEEVPDNIALLYGFQSMTYKELDIKSTQLATKLRASGVKNNSIVAIITDRSFDMIIAIYGVLKAGGAYMPIDPNYPEERIKYMIEDSGAMLLLVQESYLHKINYSGITINLCDKSIYSKDVERIESLSTPDSLAYVIYTSGSTGKPKGVMISHKSVVNMMFALQSYYPIYEGDAYILKTTYTFDVSVSEIFGWFLGKGRLVILRKDEEKEPLNILKSIKNYNVTHINLVPSYMITILNIIDEEGIQILRSLKYIILAGEALPKEIVRRYFDTVKSGRLENVYGPTEATIYAINYTIHSTSHIKDIPIGKPMKNYKAYVVDHQNNLQPVGVVGELCLAGNGLAKGYINNKKLTNEKFIENPFEPGEKMYKTGDAARWNSDGNIEFVGRIDNQVKIRGYRVELGEIENILLKFEKINEVAVIAKGELNNKYLCAYIVCTNDTKDEEIREFLLSELPEYMVPSVFVRLNQLIYTLNGKVDKKSLSKIKDSNNQDVKMDTPIDEVQKRIFDIWKATLGRDDFGIHENFFDKGGNSLLLVEVHKQLQALLKIKLSITNLFQYPTISSLSQYIINEKNYKKNKDKKQILSKNINSYKEKETDIAIIGMSGRFPKAENISELWDNIQKGVNCISFFTDEELQQSSISEVYSDKTKYVKARGIVNGIELFDASFFGFSPREAEAMDPQQRIFLECAYHALEDAGYNSDEYNGDIGVFAGSSMSTYLLTEYISEKRDTSNGNFQLMIGNDKDFLSTRVSYKLGLKGPSITIQTACSTSLVAIHMACMSLINGETDIAISGGVSLKVPQKEGYIYKEGGIYSPDGYCRVFDNCAKGTVGGNGVGVVVLKKLSEAIKDGDNIYAVIKGSAINNDGNTKVGFTAPSVNGQMDVILKTLKKSGVNPETIGYVEAHGTGTELGDPIEIKALSKAYENYTDKKQYCAIGSIKANIGHLDAAAGVTGVIKTILCLKNKKLVPSINFKEPNNKIDFGKSPFFVNTILRDWESEDVPRRAAVSSFGIGGTNAHVILEEYERNSFPKKDNKSYLMILSAKTRSALDMQTLNLKEHFKKNMGIDLAEAEFTLKVGRKEYEYRKTFVCYGIEDAINIMEDNNAERIKTYHVANTERPLVLMFTGQGSQYVNMARKLYEDEEVFRSNLNTCCELLKPYIGFDLIKILYPEKEKYEESVKILNQTIIAQPAIFAIEYSMAKQWLHWGIKPWAFIGHSIGEYVAACISGVFNLEDAIKLIAARGNLMQNLPKGSMIAVGLNESNIKKFQGKLSIAAINSPGLCVLSGEDREIDDLEVVLQEKNIFYKRLETSHAFHSKMMAPIVNEFKKIFSTINIKKPNIPYISCVTGTWIKNDEVISASYWVRHLLETVRFADGICELQKRQGCIFLEVGPGKTLASIIKHNNIDGDNEVFYSIANPKEQDLGVEFCMNVLGQLWGNGIKINWKKMYEKKNNKRISLPGYPFERKYYWFQQSEDSKETSKYVEFCDSKVGINTQYYPRPSLKNEYIKPTKASEKIMVGIWEEFLGIRPIGINDNFFELGGHSLMATQIISQVREIFRVELSLQTIFITPTVQEVVRSLYDIYQDVDLVEQIATLYQEGEYDE